jgi:hypothetical protein
MFGLDGSAIRRPPGSVDGLDRILNFTVKCASLPLVIQWKRRLETFETYA